jgi:predicted helicase
MTKANHNSSVGNSSKDTSSGNYSVVKHSPLHAILENFRSSAKTEREKGTYFEELVLLYFQNEPKYKDKFEQVWTYGDWAKHYHSEKGGKAVDGRDTGIDLVAKARGMDEYHAIQCKFYDGSYRVQKSDIDSFFTASGQKPFTHRFIVSTTNNWGEHAENALLNQNPPVTKIDLNDLESSIIDWSKYQSKAKLSFREKKKLRPHQSEAVKAVEKGLESAERGKLIMACGTGKTFTSLKIAEKLAGKGKRVLFLVPSLSLLSQTLTEWTQESELELHSFAVCSDSEVGKKKDSNEDTVETIEHELRYPATTDPKRLAFEMDKIHDAKNMSVVFSTYHSIEVVHQAQSKYKLPEFDLIICDEAHRTTGATFASEDESHFVKVHDGKFIKGSKRIYMTATPRIYADTAKITAEKDNVTLCSMDDESLYGKELFIMTFSEAVRRDLLVDYKVIVLAVDEDHINARLQKLLSDEDNQIKVDDAAKIVGCWKALSKQGSREDSFDDEIPLRKAVAFCQVIEYQEGAKTHKISSKVIAKMFGDVVDAYQEKEKVANPLRCKADHVDGGMNASDKEAKLRWLKEETDENVCRILSNVRCLSEGVDVPALDAVLFLSPRNSQVDVVQSVGRVMRKASGKKRGYVILPVVIPSGMEAHEALNDNKTYRVVWQVLQALRSHDDRFDAMINKLDLNGPDTKRMEVIAVTDKISPKTRAESTRGKKETGRGGTAIGATPGKKGKDDAVQPQLEFEIGEIEMAIYAKVVQKCGNRQHWEDWANDIAKIANTHISRISALVADPTNTKEIAAFRDFAEELRDDLNDSITDSEVVEMLAQHMITKPVFDALFSNYAFTKNNPVSQAMDRILKILEKQNLGKEADTLERFYESVRLRAEGIENAEGRQKIILELYDKFFRNAFPRLTERLGIVYTPVEAVDFIIHSVQYLLEKEFGLTLGHKDVNVLDPFTGTGTFITRLMQSGILNRKELIQKYKNGLHANEMVLLAYYIASINIESVYHTLTGEDYSPFEGILLTDTFQLYEKDDLISHYLPDNSERRTRQKAQKVQVVVCNPPYSAGQESANDNNQNIKYPGLDARIEETYVKHSKATNKNAVYDSYIRAIRWASDRIGDSGVLGIITNAGFIEGNAMDGLRKCLAEEFSSLYIFHLRGNQRTSGELSRREGGKLFGSGSRAPIAITFLVKNPKDKTKGKIYFHDIGDYLSREEKLEKIQEYASIAGIEKAKGFVTIQPDKYNDWINQRDDSFYEFIPIGDKKDKNSLVLFENYSRGLETNRDAWVYNSSKIKLKENLIITINFYNDLVKKLIEFEENKTLENKDEIEKFAISDITKISWNRSLKNDLYKKKFINFYQNSQIRGLYRPFNILNVYYHKDLCAYLNQLPKFFPFGQSENLLICITGLGESKAFSALVTNLVPNLHLIAGSQCFPLYLYDTEDSSSDESKEDLFTASKKKSNPGEPQRRYAITDAGLEVFAKAYPKEKITKEDLFYYIYGLLHSPDYRAKYADNLSKELPRIPAVKKASDFRAFEKAGRDLARLHIDYEKVKPYPVKLVTAKPLTKPDHYYVRQMKYRKDGKVKDLSTVIYNEFITITEIPVEAYEYVVNGKSALDWIIERYCVKTDKDSGIVNDANLWGLETENNPKYPLELFQRVITVSLETMKIVKGLPRLEV